MTIGISKERLIDFDPWAYDNQQNLLNAILEQCTELNPWMPMETAPKDRYIRLYDEVGQIDGRWFPYDEELGTGYWAGNDMGLEPTHWQELPENPK